MASRRLSLRKSVFESSSVPGVTMRDTRRHGDTSVRAWYGEDDDDEGNEGDEGDEGDDGSGSSVF